VINTRQQTLSDLDRLVRTAPIAEYPALLAALHSDPRSGGARLCAWLEARLTADREERERVATLHAYERKARLAGRRAIAGIDEAGRGPLAGPVVAAAVILPDDCFLRGLNDSKQVTPAERERLYDEIRTVAIAWCVGIADIDRIETVNILNATYEAMTSAVNGLSTLPDYLLLDAVRLPAVTLPQEPVIHGDALSASIAAASIIAKVTRDRMMVGADREYPGYGFAKHKGYGTAEHWEALRRLGPCPLHRLSFLSALTSDVTEAND
jgi:ribonuclease HII